MCGSSSLVVVIVDLFIWVMIPCIICRDPLLIRIHTHRRVAFIFCALDFLCDLFCGEIYISAGTLKAAETVKNMIYNAALHPCSAYEMKWNRYNNRQRCMGRDSPPSFFPSAPCPLLISLLCLFLRVE